MQHDGRVASAIVCCHLHPAFCVDCVSAACEVPILHSEFYQDDGTASILRSRYVIPLSTQQILCVCVFFLGRGRREGRGSSRLLAVLRRIFRALRLVKTFSSARPLSSLLAQIFTHTPVRPSTTRTTTSTRRTGQTPTRTRSTWSHEVGFRMVLREQGAQQEQFSQSLPKRLQGGGFAQCLLPVADFSGRGNIEYCYGYGYGYGAYSPG